LPVEWQVCSVIGRSTLNGRWWVRMSCREATVRTWHAPRSTFRPRHHCARSVSVWPSHLDGHPASRPYGGFISSVVSSVSQHSRIALSRRLSRTLCPSETVAAQSMPSICPMVMSRASTCSTNRVCVSCTRLPLLPTGTPRPSANTASCCRLKAAGERGEGRRSCLPVARSALR